MGWFDEAEHSSGKLTANLATDATYVRGAVGDVFGVAFQNLTTLVLGYFIALAFDWRMALLITGGSLWWAGAGSGGTGRWHGNAACSNKGRGGMAVVPGGGGGSGARRCSSLVGTMPKRSETGTDAGLCGEPVMRWRVVFAMVAWLTKRQASRQDACRVGYRDKGKAWLCAPHVRPVL